jgi:hypothetical protein
MAQGNPTPQPSADLDMGREHYAVIPLSQHPLPGQSNGCLACSSSFLTGFTGYLIKSFQITC